MDHGLPDSQRREMPAAIVHLSQQVIAAEERIRSSITETPLELVSQLVPNLPISLYFKMENRQETGSFKLRGATNASGLRGCGKIR